MGFNNQRSKKNRYFLLSLVGIGSAVYLFRHSLFILGAEALMHFASKEGAELNYEDVFWENERVIVAGVNYQNHSFQMKVDRMEVGCAFDLRRLYIEPRLFLSHPEVTLLSNTPSSDSMGGLVIAAPTKHFGVKFDIQNGVLQLAQKEHSQRLYFSFESGAAKDQIGKFALSYDPSLLFQPILSIDLNKKENNLFSSIKIQSASCAPLIQLTSFFYPEVQEGWENIQGEVEIEGVANFSEAFHLERMNCQVDVKNLALHNPVLGIQAKTDHFHGEFSFPADFVPEAVESEQTVQPIWKRIFATGYLQKGELRISNPITQKEWGLTDAETYLMLDPKKDPSFYLKGGLLDKGKTYPLNIDGKGYVHEDKSFWLEMNMELAQAEKEAMKLFFSACSAEKEAYVLQADFKNVGSDQLSLAKELLSLPLPELEDMQITSGEVNGKLTAWIHKKTIHRINLEEIHSKNLGLSIPSLSASGAIEELNGEGSFERDALGEWSIVNLNAKGNQASIVSAFNDQSLECSKLDMHFVVQDRLMQHSWIKGSLLGIDSHIVFNDAGAEVDANIKLHFSADKLGQFFGEGMQPLLLSTAIKKKNNRYELTGALHVAHENGESLQFGGELSTSSLFEAPLLTQGWFRTDKLSQDSFSPFLKRFFPQVSCSGEVDLFGTSDANQLQVSIQTSALKIDHPLVACTLSQIGEKDPSLIYTEGRAVFTYDFTQSLWKGEIPVHGAQVQDKTKGLLFERVDAKITIAGDHISSNDLSAEIEGLRFNGQFDWKATGEATSELRASASHVAGSADALASILNRFGWLTQLKRPIQGEVTSGDRDCHLFAQIGPENTQTDWQIKAAIKQIGWQINPESQLRNLNFDIELSSKQNRLSLANVSGDLILQNHSVYQLGAKDFQVKLSDPAECLFDVHLREGSKEVARLAGTAKEIAPSEIQVKFNGSSTHFFGTHLEISQLIIKDWSHVAHLTLKPSVKIQELLSQTQFLSKTGMTAADALFHPLLSQLGKDGVIAIEADYDADAKRFQMHANSGGLTFRGEPIQNFNCALEKIDQFWSLKELQADSLFLKANMSMNGDEWSIPIFDFTSGQNAFKANAVYDRNSGDLNGRLQYGKLDFATVRDWLGIKESQIKGAVKSEGEFKVHFPKNGSMWSEGEISLFADTSGPGDLQMQNKANCKFHYSQESGLAASDIAIHTFGKCKDKFTGTCQIEGLQLSANLQQGALKNIHFTFSPEMMRAASLSGVMPEWSKNLKWDESLEGNAELQIANGKCIVQASLKDGYYWWGESVWNLNQVSFDYRDGVVSAAFHTQYERVPLAFNARINKEKGEFEIKEASQAAGIKAEFLSEGKNFTCDNIQGTLCGLDVNFVKNPAIKKGPFTVLSGNLKWDANGITAFLSKESEQKFKSLQMGQGYELSGNLLIGQGGLDSLQFTGMLKGENFEFAGYKFQSMEAQAEITPQAFSLHHLRLEDEAGFANVKQVKCVKSEDAVWRFEIPLIQVQDFRPSLLRKPGEVSKTIKPLIVKHFTLTNCHGALNDLSTFTGRGRLDFTNAFKKEQSLLGLPLEMIKNIGLDPGIFTPIYGEIDYFLENGKFYLIEMHNTHSEGRRSEFYLSSDDAPCYIDFDGKVRVDIKMKQNVLLNFTEPFVLTIRGTVGKPKYGLQR